MAWIETKYPRLTAVLTKTDSISAIRKLGRKGSKRAKQRAATLYIADLEGGSVSKGTLERACLFLGCYNAANFTQNMKKDAARGLWTIDRDRYSRRRGPSGWTLTAEGRRLARLVSDAVDAGWNVLQAAIRKTLTVTVARCLCSYCGDEVTDADKASCSGCKLSVHATCWSELKRHDGCIAMGCRSRLVIVAIPADFVAERPVRHDCRKCQDTGKVTQLLSANVAGCDRCAGWHRRPTDSYASCYEHAGIQGETYCACQRGREMEAANEAASAPEETAETAESVEAPAPRTGGFVIRVRAVDAALPADLGDDD